MSVDKLKTMVMDEETSLLVWMADYGARLYISNICYSRPWDF